MKRSHEKLPIINPHAAGIDVGSRSHMVSVSQREEDVKEFGVYTSDHDQIIQYLRQNSVETVAMESTGSYWQTLFSALQEAGFEVLLVSGHQTKNVRAKTDVKDCMWIQKLHSLGLLAGCFLADEHTARLKVILRHRSSLIEESSKMVNKMQKAMRMMNIRLDVVLSDITGKSGISIITAILSGERKGETLARLADRRVKKSFEEIASALQGHWNEELLYELRDCYEIYGLLQEKIKSCDKKIQALLEEITKDVDAPDPAQLTRKQTKGKNQPKFNLSELSYKFYGVDLFAIQSISASTVLTLICEIGQGIYKFQSAKQFASFLRLAPNNRISGRKVISSRTPKGSNRFALALRNAANTIDRARDSVLKKFFQRVAYKKGRGSAITATARKLAVIIWNMVVKKEKYNPLDCEQYEQQIRDKTIIAIRKKMQKLSISTSDLLYTEPQMAVS